MKKLTTIALTGALALGALAGATAFNAKPAAAAEKVQYAAGWNDPLTVWDLTAGFDNMPIYLSQYIKPAYKTGDYFTVKTAWDNQMEGNPLKIYRVMDDNSLVRYKTIYPFAANNGTVNQAVWHTDITSAYDAGTYVAVVNVHDHFYKSEFFTINK